MQLTWTSGKRAFIQLVLCSGPLHVSSNSDVLFPEPCAKTADGCIVAIESHDRAQRFARGRSVANRVNACCEYYTHESILPSVITSIILYSKLLGLLIGVCDDHDQ